MSPNDALFTVRVISDGHSAISAMWAAIVPLLSVLVGGLITYRATVTVEDRKRRRETELLVGSVAAELRASTYVIDMMTNAAKSVGAAGATDAFRFGRVSNAALPAIRLAAASPGVLAPPIAEKVAKFVLLLHNLDQQQGIISAMQAANVLTDEKLQERMTFVGPVAHGLVETGKELLALIEKHHVA